MQLLLHGLLGEKLSPQQALGTTGGHQFMPPPYHWKDQLFFPQSEGMLHFKFPDQIKVYSASSQLYVGKEHFILITYLVGKGNPYVHLDKIVDLVLHNALMIVLDNKVNTKLMRN